MNDSTKLLSGAASAIALIISLLLSSCLERLDPEELPPLPEEQRLDGSLYEPPTEAEDEARGYGYGASGSSPAYGSAYDSDELGGAEPEGDEAP